MSQSYPFQYPVNKSRREAVMVYVPPPPPSIEISLTFNVSFKWEECEKICVIQGFDKLIRQSPAFMKRFPPNISSLRIEIQTPFHFDKLRDTTEHINCMFVWAFPNGELAPKPQPVHHAYFTSDRQKIFQLSTTVYTHEKF
jgi:hypothetical protein